MQYRPLGATGLELSVLGFGASPLGGVFEAIDEAEGVRAVHHAVDHGVNYIDVSPFYGMTRAETVLGRALLEIPRDRYYLSTKVGRYGGDEFDFSAARVATSLEESLRRLNVEYVDIVLCHDIEFGSLDQIVNETLPALRREVEKGKVRFIGISGYPLPIFDYVTQRAQVDVVLSYCQYTLQNQALAAKVPGLREKEIGVINAAPMCMGLLTNKGAPPWHPATAEMKAACKQAALVCAGSGVDLARLALQFAVGEPGIASTLVGMAGIEELERNLRLIAEPLDNDLLDEVLTLLKPVHNQLWQSGRLENN